MIATLGTKWVRRSNNGNRQVVHIKKCTYCGKEYADDMTVCAIDGEPLTQFPEQAKFDKPLKPPGPTADRTAAPSESQKSTSKTFWQGQEFIAGVVLVIGLLFV